MRLARASRLRGLSPRVRGNPGPLPHCRVCGRSIPACAGEPGGGLGIYEWGGVYPRVCGGTRSAMTRSLPLRGLSPRVRGNLAARIWAAWYGRSIPACAGEPGGADNPPSRNAVYPRVCGGTHHRHILSSERGGLSPRVRGNPPFTPNWRAGSRVYPRVCGGTDADASSAGGGEGLSPRVRGNPDGVREAGGTGRSIPACAGEPVGWNNRPLPLWVYPRVCGGTTTSWTSTTCGTGLSPRVRGNLLAISQRADWRRSIPACAGEPAVAVAPPPPLKVYPRVCGGTPRPSSRITRPAGLSPRVRGNPPLRSRSVLLDRSIPACAGEPSSACGASLPTRVYPRVCGGTGCYRKIRRRGLGLSPRVRGNPEALRLELVIPGSIPACAGEPHDTRPGRQPQKVYPRVCGGTCGDPGHRRLNAGLSPRVRGNLDSAAPEDVWDRSIPACAGEPSRWKAGRGTARVYPRVCGGTWSRRSMTPPGVGLSPRVRGNRALVEWGRNGGWSIPACAGEPDPYGLPPSASLVYPRVCGGTNAKPPNTTSWQGLSPRVRGNPVFCPALSAASRSIPACAGEPPVALSIQNRREVYPRVCGGTHYAAESRRPGWGLSPRVRGNQPGVLRARQNSGSIPACAGEPHACLV